MIQSRNAAASPETLLQQHRSLLTAIQHLQQAWSESSDDELAAAPGRLHGLRAGIDGLRRDLAAHFAAEENGGYMASVLPEAPQLGGQAAELLAQHAEFLRTLDEISASLSWADEAPERVGEAHAQFDRFTEQLQAHEHAEDTLVQTAFSGDLGTGD